MSISTISDYYNNWDDSKGYTEVLFRAGKILQSQELNEMQSILKNTIKHISNSILTDGDIIEGCQIIVKETNVTITAGRVYLNGDIHNIPTTNLTITGTGNELIGIKLSSEIITPDDDSELLDNATGWDNYHNEGAYRKKESVEITLDDSTATTIYTIVDGVPLTSSTGNVDVSQIDKIQATLARRTFDESGNYKVDGLKIVDKEYSDDNYIYVSLEPGKAYVRGYEISKPNATTVALERATSLRNVENEPKTYHAALNKYTLNNSYVNEITKLVGVVEKTQNVTRGSIVGGIDYLPLTPVVDILTVVQDTITYTLGTDFQLTSDGIDWSIGTKAPDPGSSYSVTWTYNKNMTKGTDYSLVTDGVSGYVTFLESGDKPIENSTFLIYYNFMLCRRDVISLDSTGKVTVTQGQPDTLRTVESPSVSNDSVLVMGSVLLKPNTNTIEIINNHTQAIPMLNLYKMLSRIETLEYNQSITDLDTEAAEGENATELVGVFTDGFIGLTKSDIYHSEWAASIDLDNKELTLPSDTYITELNVNENTDFNAGIFNTLLTSPYTEITLLSQSFASSIQRINAYNAFPKSVVVTINPSVDNWIDESTITVSGGTKTTSVTLRRWWYHKNESWADEEKKLWQSYGLADGGSSLGLSSTTVTTTEVTSSVLNEAIMYMRQKKIDVTIANCDANRDNLTATFDDKPVELFPSQAVYRGTTSGTLKADSKGVAKGYFVVPANTLCGTRELKVYPASMPSLYGTANYTSNGRKITTTNTVFLTKTVLNATDPIAQSFQFNEDKYITGVGLYFYDKDPDEQIIIQIRNMVNGYPGTTVYAEKIIQGSDVSTSTTAVNETKIEFDNPVYCNADEQYCFTVLSNSDVDSVWVAQTTETDISSKTQISKNPYLNGMMFSSSNALTWTASQSTDIKFNLYGAQFNTSGYAYFKDITSAEVDRILIAAEQNIPSETSISWTYSINGGDWLPIEVYSDKELNEIAKTISLRIDITAKTNTSPAVLLDGICLAGFKNKDQCVYISKNVSVTDGYNTVKQVIDLALPANTNVNMYYATDTDGKVWNPTSSTNTVQKSSEYKTYTFEDTLSKTAKNYRCKVVLSTSSQLNRPKAQNLRSIMKTI